MGWGWLGSESQPSLHRHDKGEDDPREDLRRALLALTTRAKAKAEADATQVERLAIPERPGRLMARGPGTGGISQHSYVEATVLAQGDLGVAIPDAGSFQDGGIGRVSTDDGRRRGNPEDLALVRARLDMEFQHG